MWSHKCFRTCVVIYSVIVLDKSIAPSITSTRMWIFTVHRLHQEYHVQTFQCTKRLYIWRYPCMRLLKRCVNQSLMEKISFWGWIKGHWTLDSGSEYGPGTTNHWIQGQNMDKTLPTIGFRTQGAWDIHHATTPGADPGFLKGGGGGHLVQGPSTLLYKGGQKGGVRPPWTPPPWFRPCTLYYTKGNRLSWNEQL